MTVVEEVGSPNVTTRDIMQKFFKIMQQVMYVKKAKSSILFFSIFFLGILSATSQEYSNKEIGFDANGIRQRFVERGIPQEEITELIQRERELHLDMYLEMLMKMQRFETEALPQTNNLQARALAPCTVSQVERDALVALYNATDGPNWTNKWDLTTPVCDWSGVTVVDGKVTRLDLSRRQLSGSIPPELGNLSNLTQLYLNDNQLSGSIPAALGSLSNLTYLDLFRNQLSGVIPIELGNISNLRTLILGFNQLSGSIPMELGGLFNLTILYLNHNRLNGSIPAVLGNLISLTHLYLNSNQLTGSIPSQLGQLTNLTELSLSINQLTGSIPTQLGQLSRLTVLLLYYNQLNGNIPIEIGQLVNLNQLHLNLNQLTGSIPSQLGQLLALTNLSLNGNQLTGNIPSELGLLKNLVYLFLESNELTGSIPTELGSLSNVVQLHLNSNQLSGNIPSEFGQLVNVTRIQLGNNQLTGNIPPELGQLLFLRNLELQNNQLSGSLPIELNQLSNLLLLYFENNMLTGNIPDFSGISTLDRLKTEGNRFVFFNFESKHTTYKNLAIYRFSPQAKVDQEETLFVAENGTITLTTTALTSTNNSYQWFKDGTAISGATSKEYLITNATATDAGAYHFEATNSVVTGLTLTRNNITLTIGPPDTCGVSETEKQALLDLYNSTNGDNWTNTLAGNQPWDATIPVCDWFGLTVVDGKVTRLDLVRNNLTGQLPLNIGDLVNLLFVELAHNQISGELPNSFGSLINLNTALLELNQFSGSIPSSFGNLSSLSNLKLNNNLLSGSIPVEIGNLSNLRTLNINQNNLAGNLPAEIGNLNKLVFLYLSDNDISGDIPPELSNLSNLRYLWLQGNQLTGAIPNVLGNLTSLIDFHVDRNQLTGIIPIELGNLVNLDRIRLNSNQLSGSIPSQFGNFSVIKTIQVNNNLLSGTVPDFTGLINLDRLMMDVNSFVFSDFEVQHNAYSVDISTYRYSPQAKVDQEETLSVAENGTITLTTTALTSLNNSYQWFKDGQPIVGATSKEYIINTAEPTDAGVYYFEATNSVVTDLTLTRNTITLTIDPPVDNCGVSETEKQALLELYANTNGDNWTNTLANNQPWDTNIPVCDWFGVTVVNGKVTAIALPNNSLLGTLPESIGSFSALNFLDLGNNGISGELPASLGSLLQLKQLLIADNNLSGALPPSLGSASNLEEIDFSNNRIQSQIPISFCNLSKVIKLKLGNNQLYGNIPRQLELMRSLQFLDISHNKLTGEIPFAIARLSKLAHLLLNDNLLSGTIPITTSTNSIMEDFRFENNKFIFSNFETKHEDYFTNLIGSYGYAPQAKTDLEETKSVTAGNSITLTTKLSSTNNSYQWYKNGILIPDAISKELLIESATVADAAEYYFLATNSTVTKLELQRNTITINVHTTCDVPLVQREMLIALYNATAGNNWENTLQAQQPWAINDINSLVCNWYGVTVVNNEVIGISLVDNGLVGVLPSFSALPSLQMLDVSQNGLQDNITGVFEMNTNLQILNLENNAYIFEGLESDYATLTTQMGNQFTYAPQAKIEMIDFENVEVGLGLSLIAPLMSPTNEYQWYRNGLPIDGATSMEFNIPITAMEDAGGYHFTATNLIVDGLTLESEMVMVNINGGNDACGVSDEERQILIAFYNAMDGSNWVNNSGWNTDASVCDWYGITTAGDNTLSYVTHINLENNGLRGEIIDGVTDLLNLNTLNLSNNSVVGAIPLGFDKLVFLEYLKLNNNILVGEIPMSLGMVGSLIQLDLGNNRLSGIIPSNIASSTLLATLNLNDNKLEGNLPSSLYTAQGLTRFNVSNNKLTGAISQNLSNLVGLQEFWLSNNNFSGSFPVSLLPMLKSVRLDNNAFRGDIPRFTFDYNIPGTELKIENNRFVFSDFETEYPDYSTKLSVFSYDPQARVDFSESKKVLEGENITLGTVALTSTNNTYQWFRDGVKIPGATESTYVITNFSAALHEGLYHFLANNTTIANLELQRNPITLNVDSGVILVGDECDILLASETDGSFENCADEIGTGYRELGLDCSGWFANIAAKSASIYGDPSVYKVPIPESSMVLSPNGGIMASSSVYFNSQNSTGIQVGYQEFNTTLNNLKIGTEYVVQFYQANGTDFSEKYTDNDYGGWQVRFGSQIKLSSRSYVVQSPQWSLVTLSFVVTTESQLLEFRPYANKTGQPGDANNNASKELFIDGIKVFEMGSSCSGSAFTQYFCTAEKIPTVDDLKYSELGKLPTSWYLTETGGTPLTSTTRLQEGTYWAEVSDNKDGRIQVTVIIDEDAPVGDAIQYFDFDAGEYYIKNIDVEANNNGNIGYWFDSNESTTILDPLTIIKDGDIYFASTNKDGSGGCRLKVTIKAKIIGGDCEEVLSSTIDGSFEGAIDVVVSGRNGTLGNTGWTITEGTPDTFSPPLSDATDLYLSYNFSNSPDKGLCAGALRVGDTTESFSTSVSGLTVGTTYLVEFYQANATNVLDVRIQEQTQGFWEVRFGNETKNSPALAPPFEASLWSRAQLEFVAVAGKQELNFSVNSTALDATNAYPVYMLMDGIRVYVKPNDSYSTACISLDTQNFCDGVLDSEPYTISDLVAPSPLSGNVLWYSAQTGGVRYFDNIELGGLPSYFVWADDGSSPRVPVEIVFSFGAPKADDYQFFDITTSPTLANIQVEGEGISWYTTFTGGSVLPVGTPLNNGTVYYASGNGVSCRSAVEVGVGIPTPIGSGYQEFCSTDNSTIAHLVTETTSSDYTIQWYSEAIEGTPLNSIHSLENGTTYYAAQTNGTATSEVRNAVRVGIMDVGTMARTYERDAVFPIESTISNLTDFFLLDADTVWYNDFYEGESYSGSAKLGNGETYYARIGQGACAALKVLAVTIEIGEVEVPELITCIKFVPQPGDKYVISGWTREVAFDAVPANTLTFNEDQTAKDALVKLLGGIKDEILDKQELPKSFVIKQYFPDLDVEALLPYVKNFIEKNVTVYDFVLENENFDGVKKAVGFSFALAPESTYRFMYKTPVAEVSFSFSRSFSLGYRYPIRNYNGLEISFKDVKVLSNGKFQIVSSFSFEPTPEDGRLKSNFSNHTTDSRTQSGMESSIQLYDYQENFGYQVPNYKNSSIELSYKDSDGVDLPQAMENAIFEPNGAIIDGWQRISSDFTIPNDAAYMKITLRNKSDGINVYFDDVRMHPFNSNMKTFVYDPLSQRLQSELDENNYATFYEYDTEGGLVRVKKETERGVYTIQETRSGNSKLNSKN
ncbi:MAG: leucine-rich repeat domain-containing protein [Cellulophaga sp.]